MVVDAVPSKTTVTQVAAAPKKSNTQLAAEAALVPTHAMNGIIVISISFKQILIQRC